MSDPVLFTLFVDRINQVKNQFDDDQYTQPRHALLKCAEAKLLRQPFTVTHKSMVPSSGDKHDYLSMAPYWWPDPADPRGPYIRKDGEFNPATKTNDTDSVRFQEFTQAVYDLSLSYYFTNKRPFGERAKLFLKTWFINPDTRMNPHLQFGQCIQGVNNGSGIGIIETRLICLIIDSIQILHHCGILSSEDYDRIKSWFQLFLNWLLTSQNGIEECRKENNHGTFYDAQVCAIALFLGRRDIAEQRIQFAMHRRLPKHIAKDGTQPLELARTRPFHYSVFNIGAYVRLAHYGDVIKIDKSLWNANPHSKTDKPILFLAVKYLAQALINGQAEWPYKNSDLTGVYLDQATQDGLIPILIHSINVYGQDPDLMEALNICKTKQPWAADLLFAEIGNL